MKRILLFISAFVPLYFLLFVKIIVNIIFGNLHFNVLNSLSIIIFILAIIFGIVGVKLCLKQNKTDTKIEIISKKSLTEQYFLGYFSLFVLFALSFDIEMVNMFIVFVLINIMIGIVYIRNDLFYINPFLNLLGYNFYEIEYKKDNSTKTEIGKFLCKGKLDLSTSKFSVILSQSNFSVIKNKIEL